MSRGGVKKRPEVDPHMRKVTEAHLISGTTLVGNDAGDMDDEGFESLWWSPRQGGLIRYTHDAYYFYPASSVEFTLYRKKDENEEDEEE